MSLKSCAKSSQNRAFKSTHERVGSTSCDIDVRMERVIRAVMAAAAGLVLVATDARAEPPEIAPEHWKALVKAVRTVKREYVAPVDDARLGQACTQRVHALPALRQAPSPAPVTTLGDVPVALRAAAAMPGVAPRELVAECVAGMLASLDAHSRLLSAEESREMTLGADGGTGLELTIRDQAVVIVDVFEGGPAAAAGVQPGDRLAAIAGRSVDGLSLSEVTRRLRGRVGSPVTMTVGRGAEVLELALTRSVVKATSVRARVIEPAILYLGIRRFEERTLGEVSSAIAPLVEKIETMPRALLLDLRDDAGGLFRTAVDFAGGLLPPGAVVGSTDGRQPSSRRRITAERAWAREDVAEWLRKVPMAVLVNGGTGSGAEMVTAALQAHGRAQILGTPTAGSGSIQTILPFDDTTYLRLTTALWLTPKGEALEGRPITPDVLLLTARNVALGGAGARDAALDEAIEVLKTRRTAPR
jgi:C-terminal peptidase prc